MLDTCCSLTATKLATCAAILGKVVFVKLDMNNNNNHVQFNLGPHLV